jgi:glycosyltransferase involved in cell wall biosynthesis
LIEGSEGGLSGPLYSICMLCSNDAETVRQSIASVMELSKYRRIEVIVTDNESDDGSQKVLQEFVDNEAITVIEKKCNRGDGRELAFQASKGDYILSHMDCDDVFNAEGLNSLIARYHSSFEGKALMTKKQDSAEASNITIAPRAVLENAGGWRPLNWGEDWDIWARLANIGLYVFYPYPVENPPHTSIKVRTERYAGPSHGFGVRVAKYADALRTGRRVFHEEEHVSPAQWMAYAVARAGVFIKGKSLAPVPNPEFHEDRTVVRTN